jgi:hypothetical protein
MKNSDVPVLRIERHGENVRLWVQEFRKQAWCIEIPDSVCKSFRLVEFLNALQNALRWDRDRVRRECAGIVGAQTGDVNRSVPLGEEARTVIKNAIQQIFESFEGESRWE